MSNFSSTAIVIGAGLSGLAAARALRAKNIPVIILDSADKIAEPWRARHPQLRLNIHRHFARLPGMKMTRKDGAFAKRDTVIDYLEEYASILDIPIKFGTHIEAVARSLTGWDIHTNNGCYKCKNLIVATGRERIPNLPNWTKPGDHDGKLIHVADFGDVHRYDGKKVLVIGAGNSGTDVLNHLSRSNPKKVWVSVRNGPSILPTRIFGFPILRLAYLFTCFPKWSLDPAFDVMQRLAFGNLKRHGLPRHHLAGDTRMRKEGVVFALDDGFVAALKSGRFEVVTEATSFSADGVKLADGKKLDVDYVISATGYRTGLETLFGDLGVLDENNRPLHPTGQYDPNNPGLWFSGFTPSILGFFHSAGQTGGHIAKHISDGECQEKKNETV